LSDGLRLIALVEVLSGKRFRKFNKRPTFRNQKLENVTISLRFLELDEGIKIVNIGIYSSVYCSTHLFRGMDSLAKKTYNFAPTQLNGSQIVCSKSFFSVRTMKLQIYHGHFILTENKHIKLLVIKQSKEYIFMPKMHKNTTV